MRGRIQNKIAAAVCGVVALYSCAREIDNPPAATGSTREVEFSLTLPVSTLPTSRTNPQNSRKPRALSYADEYAVSTIDVLVFRGGAYAYSSHGTITAPPTAAGEDAAATMSFRVALAFGAEPCELMFAANAREVIEGAYPTGIPAGTPRADVAAALTIAMPAGGWVDDASSADYRPIPMWGNLENQTINDTYTAPASLQLVRAMARVDVRLGNNLSTDRFSLRTVRAYNYSARGHLIPGSGTLAASAAGEWIERSADNAGRQISGQIYLFEAPAGTLPSDGGDWMSRNPCVVIGGNFGGSARQTWYRIDLAQRDERGNLIYLPVRRNSRYTITINGISGQGFDTPELAWSSVATNVTAQVVVWDDQPVDFTDGRLDISARTLTMPWAAYRTGRVDVRSTDRYTVQWLDSAGAVVASGSSEDNTVLSSPLFDLKIVKGPADNSEAGQLTHLTFRTRQYNLTTAPRAATLRIVSGGGAAVDIAVEQEFAAKYSSRGMNVLAAYVDGHLGAGELPQHVGPTGTGNPIRTLLSKEFRPDGSVPIGGFDHRLAYFYVTSPADLATLRAAIMRQDIIYLPWACESMHDDTAAAILEWLDSNPRHVLVMACDLVNTNRKLRDKLVADGNWVNDKIYETFGPANQGFTRSNPVSGSEPFFDGPFGVVGADASFVRADDLLGYTTTLRAGLVPLIASRVNSSTTTLAVDPARGIVYMGDVNTFGTIGDNDATRLLGNLWTWIAVRQIYGPDPYSADFD